MYTHSDPEHKKSIHYKDPYTMVSRRECIAFAIAINNPRLIKDLYNDWVTELGDEEDRTNIEAIATWVNRQDDILLNSNKKVRVKLLRKRLDQTLKHWMKHYMKRDFEKVG